MKQFLFVFSIIGLLSFLFVNNVAYAQTYPISALANCRDAKECFYYCEIPYNQPSCWSYNTYIAHKDVLAESTSSAQITEITFPIPQLGNCGSYQACKSYCNQAQNHDACTAYSKAHFHTVNPSPKTSTNAVLEKILQDAKTGLGCDSASSCSTFCRQEANRQKCETFFTKEGLATTNTSSVSGMPSHDYNINPSGIPFCTNAQSCSNFCAQSGNQGVCKSFGTYCSAFCAGNPGACQNTQGNQEIHSGTSSAQPSERPAWLQGCNNTQQCYQYCLQNPGKCPGFPYKTATASATIKPFEGTRTTPQQ